jgi:hypothetical protein
MKKLLAAAATLALTCLSATAAMATLPPPPTRAPDSYPPMTGAFDTQALWAAAQNYAINTSYDELQRVMGAQGSDERAVLSVSWPNPWSGGVGTRRMIRQSCDVDGCQWVMVEIKATALFGVYQGFGNRGGASEYAAMDFNPTAMVTALEAQGITPETLADADLSFLPDYAALSRRNWIAMDEWSGRTCPAIEQGLEALEGAAVPVDFREVGTDTRGNLPPIQGFEQPTIRIRTLGGGDAGTLVVQYGQVEGLAARVIALTDRVKAECGFQVQTITGP